MGNSCSGRTVVHPKYRASAKAPAMWACFEKGLAPGRNRRSKNSAYVEYGPGSNSSILILCLRMKGSILRALKRVFWYRETTQSYVGCDCSTFVRERRGRLS